jgi:WD40 repeat protein
MKSSIRVNEICCWIRSACAVSVHGAEYTVELPMAEPLTVAYSPSDKQIAVGGLAPERDGPADGIVALVDAMTGKLQSLLQHSDRIGRDSDGSRTRNPIHAVAYSPDGKVLAIAAPLSMIWRRRLARSNRLLQVDHGANLTSRVLEASIRNQQ